MSNKDLLPIALGKEKADLVFKNGKIIDVFNEKVIEEDLAISNGVIIGFGKYEGKEEVDLEGKFISPGFIDAHLHLESAMVTIEEFAKTVIPLGTLTLVADPHEIANVAGKVGIKYFLTIGNNIPWNFNLMVPSCVPVTTFDKSGSVLNAEKIKELITEENFFGLGEVMDYEGVITGQDYIWDKIELMKDYFIDGHAPKLQGKILNAYLLAGIMADHETTSPNEALEKISKGMYIMVREGSVTRDLQSLLPAINDKNNCNFLFATDDKHPEDLISEGHINFMIKKAIKLGMEPFRAIKLATLNAARSLGLHRLGGIAPGYKADLLIIDNLDELGIFQVYKDGKKVAENGKALFQVNSNNFERPPTIFHSVNIAPIREEDFKIPKGKTYRVINMIQDQIITGEDFFSFPDSFEEERFIRYNINKIAVVERHKSTGKIGLGLIRGFGLESGAIASSIAHDSHNIIVLGTNSCDMKIAVEKIAEIQGGIVIANNQKIVDFIELPIGGLISTDPIGKVSEKLQELRKIVHNLGVKTNSPFMTLAFMGLPVVPKLKITCDGLYDVENHIFVSLVVN
ncbi:adenine deaminase [Petrotoga mobilis SJ95]|uniref:Adenine deaminase n=1 Tax=Petrotoga mobilis (strain DSM 10674 / SJ95) TaxID=403833 RepID=ADEC_PETMO|nr:adenine deaminase [Petrotoga mobilis]A9BIU9.1 RecName: Full=Adenine deaminase; Short=Adenase; Short=Adenine aminase [Petrotoga mobilis SJ95]ABX32437.1 adenine deaminase [Petrotoga mobilis SJ95]MDK2812040.1 adenine deaminase [Petrotoga sp.]